MSKAGYICCSRCGLDIYKPLESTELRTKGYAKHMMDYYLVNDFGRQDELCSKCYGAWCREQQGENTDV